MKLIDGHTYENRKGKKHKITYEGKWPNYPFGDGIYTYSENGRYLRCQQSQADLIKDVTDPAPCLADDNDIKYISIFDGEGKYGDTEYNDGMVDGVSIDDIHTHMLRLRRKLYGYNRLVAKGIFHARKTK